MPCIFALPTYSKLPSATSVRVPLLGRLTGVVSRVSRSWSISLSLFNKPGAPTNNVPSALILYVLLRAMGASFTALIVISTIPVSVIPSSLITW